MKKSEIKLTLATILVTVSISGVLTIANFVPNANAASSKFAFTSYEVSRSADQSFAGVSCPNAAGNCWNWNAEPNIATAPDGTIYATSENAAFNHPSECQDPTGGTISQTLYICGGTGAWKSTDGGNHFASLTQPNVNFQSGTAVTLWGGDTHVATATAKNANGYYNVYVVSLEAAVVGLVGVGEATSQDGGQTWSNPPANIQFANPISMPLVEDRPWVSAIGASTVCVSAHELIVAPDVWCSQDAGLTFNQGSTALDAAHSWLAAEINIPGSLHFDPNSGILYLPFAGVANSTEAAIDAPCGTVTACPYQFHTMWVAVSTDGGLTFTDYPIYTNPNVLVNYGTQFPAITVDQAGNVYVAYSDGTNLFYSYSTTKGQTWNGPYQVNAAPSSTAIEPWLTAGTSGKIDIVWYGTGGCTGVSSVDNCPESATWQVYMAQNLNVLSTPSAFTQVAVTGVIHQGPVCTNGGNCQPYRGLFDDFGVTADPKTGLATIVYDNDMYTPSDSNNLPNPDCVAQYTSPSDLNQQDCVHTDIAHQTSGPGLVPKHSFNINSQKLVQQDSLTAAYSIQLQNTGDLSITSVTVSLANLPLSLSYDSAFPFQPGTTVNGYATVSLQNVALVLGVAYPTVVTATFSDGTTISQSSSVAYTLT